MYDNKKIFILGLARSGYEVAKLLSKHNCHIVLVEENNNNNLEHIQELESLGVNVIITPNSSALLDDSFAYVVKNPGIRIDHPLCIKALELNIPIINELEVAYHYLPNGIKLIGVTGSNGKTTTTTLVYKFLKEGNLPVHLGGNIGYPMSSLTDKVKENDIIVLEISAQQLHDFKDFKFDISILTNLTEVHIDFFKTYENYLSNKKKIFDHQTSFDIAIINGNDKDSLNITKDILAKKIFFSASKKSNLYLENKAIYYDGKKIIDTDDIRLKGNHNYENIMCAIAVAKEFNVSNETIYKVLDLFSGVEHRLEFVNKVNEREFYNDSKATNVKSTIIALDSFNKPIILLLGGMERNHSFNDLLPHMKNVRFVLCFGQTKDRIEQFCKENNIECYKKDVLEEAVKTAYNLSNENDIILLSPACASWDQYAKFEDRGDEFKKIVESLK